MIENLVVGCLTMTLCLLIQCVIIGLLLRVAYHLERKRLIRTALWTTYGVLIAVMLVLLLGNLLQMSLWGGLFLAYGEFADYPTAFYHSVVNFSTLGYGDVVMSEERRLLGALEAANGVLMFTLTGSFLFVILSALAQREWNERLAQDAVGERPKLPDVPAAS